MARRAAAGTSSAMSLCGGAPPDEDDPLEAELGAGVGGDGEVADGGGLKLPPSTPTGRGSTRPAAAQVRTCPSPQATYFRQVSSRNEIGPRTWSFCVEMPISAPRPNCPPSVKRVEAFT